MGLPSAQPGTYTAQLIIRTYARMVRWAFARFYREFAWTYDTVAALVSAGNWHAWTLAVLPYLHGSILELGSGTGNLQLAIARHTAFPQPVGLDLSPQMIALARRKVERAAATARLVRGDALALPFGPATFDTVVATFPSDYIAAPATVAEARRVLRPTGRLVIAPGACLTGAGIYRRLVELAYRVTLQQLPQEVPAPPQLPAGHLADAVVPAALRETFTYRLRQALERSGFRVQERWIAAPGGRVYLIIGEVTACPQPLPKS